MLLQFYIAVDAFGYGSAENSINSISMTPLIKYISWAFGNIPKYGSRLLRL